MSLKYLHLMEPYKIGNNVLKNRLVATCCSPAHEQGPENYPNDALFTHYVNKAKNGASLIVFQQGGYLELKKRETEEDREKLLKFLEEHPNPFNTEYGMDPGGIGRFPDFDLVDGTVQQYLSTMTEALHFYGAKCMMKSGAQRMPEGYDICEGNAKPLVVEGCIDVRTYNKVATDEMLQDIIDKTAIRCSFMKQVGFDGVYMHLAYRGSAPARFLSPLTNHRTDRYGGSLENRARYAIEMADAVKAKCGKDFLVYACVSGWEPEGGYTVDDMAEYARLFQGHYDLLEIRGPDSDHSQPTNFEPDPTPYLAAAARIKAKAPEIGIIATGGIQDLDLCEEIIASRKADFIGSGRSWVCNGDYGTLAYEGRGDDVVPCLRCNGCHLMSYYKPWNSYCAVNPVFGLEHKMDLLVPSAPDKKKKVAVVGGGPSGLEAAITAAKRGHSVTVYEKSASLCGNLKLIENVSFKWPHKKFNAYLEHQIEKHGVEVKLNTEATPELIKEGAYDAVITAIGADLVVPDIPGADRENVIQCTEVYGNEDRLAKNIVIIGGGENGVEAGMHLADHGHTVTVIETTKKLARKSIPIHYYVLLKDEWEARPGFHFILGASCTGITDTGVVYVDEDGNEKTIEAEAVVLAAGQKPRKDEALKFYGAADQFYMVGDCRSEGGVQNAMRTGFAAATEL